MPRAFMKTEERAVVVVVVVSLGWGSSSAAAAVTAPSGRWIGAHSPTSSSSSSTFG